MLTSPWHQVISFIGHFDTGGLAADNEPGFGKVIIYSILTRDVVWGMRVEAAIFFAALCLQ